MASLAFLRLAQTLERLFRGALPRHIPAERLHIADALVEALDRIHDLDLALASDQISPQERVRIEAERSSLNAEVLHLSDQLNQLAASLPERG
jgi:hypothetical protein